MLVEKWRNFEIKYQKFLSFAEKDESATYESIFDHFQPVCFVCARAKMNANEGMAILCISYLRVLGTGPDSFDERYIIIMRWWFMYQKSVFGTMSSILIKEFLQLFEVILITTLNQIFISRQFVIPMLSFDAWNWIEILWTSLRNLMAHKLWIKTLFCLNEIVNIEAFWMKVRDIVQFVESVFCVYSAHTRVEN